MTSPKSRQTRTQVQDYIYLAKEMRKSTRRRIVIKTRPGVSVDHLNGLVSRELGSEAGDIVDIEPLFDAHCLEELQPRFRDEDREQRIPDLGRYFVLTRKQGWGRRKLIGRLLKDPSKLEYAYIDRCPILPAPVFGGGLIGCDQRHLWPAGQGIDAFYAWQNSGDGSGVRFVDLEIGWQLDHPDLVDAKVVSLSGVNAGKIVHGTNVLGVVLATDNDLGGVGVVPGLAGSARVVSFLRSREPSICNVADAILSALTWLRRGDVLLLEVALSPGGFEGQLPIEVVPAVFEAMQCASLLGVVIVEPAGNGRVDLDRIGHLNRKKDEFRDSGAIVVAGAKRKMATGTTSWGSRVDCFARGLNVRITRHDFEVENQCASFDGTSAAAAIIAGAAVAMQSFARTRLGRPLDPIELRNLLSCPRLGTPSSVRSKKLIGVMPDLRKIIKYLRRVSGQSLKESDSLEIDV